MSTHEEKVEATNVAMDSALKRNKELHADISALALKLNIAIEAIDSMRRVEARKMMMPEITILAEQALKRISTTTSAVAKGKDENG